MIHLYVYQIYSNSRIYSDGCAVKGRVLLRRLAQFNVGRDMSRVR
jgi:hypothetical protein